LDYVTINYKNGDDVVGRLKLISLQYGFTGLGDGMERFDCVVSMDKIVGYDSDIYAAITDISLAPEYPLPWKVQLKKYAQS